MAISDPTMHLRTTSVPRAHGFASSRSSLYENAAVAIWCALILGAVYLALISALG
jgi:hypothetical protein